MVGKVNRCNAKTVKKTLKENCDDNDDKTIHFLFDQITVYNPKSLFFFCFFCSALVVPLLIIFSLQSFPYLNTVLLNWFLPTIHHMRIYIPQYILLIFIGLVLKYLSFDLLLQNYKNRIHSLVNILTIVLLTTFTLFRMLLLHQLVHVLRQKFDLDQEILMK